LCIKLRHERRVRSERSQPCDADYPRLYIVVGALNSALQIKDVQRTAGGNHLILNARDTPHQAPAYIAPHRVTVI
jgi:hypothetical protein